MKKERVIKANDIIREHLINNDSEEFSLMNELNDTVFEEPTSLNIKPELTPSKRHTKNKVSIKEKNSLVDKKYLKLAKNNKKI